MTGHLIHIGYAKTGSNALRRWFRGHPDLAYAEGGIAGFPDVHAIARQAAAPRNGARYVVTSSETLATPHPPVPSNAGDEEGIRNLPAAQAWVCATLAALFPNAHVLVVTRGFRSMCLSAYSQYVRSGGQGTFEGLLANARAAGPWDYDALIRLYTAAFGERRVIVMPYELLRDDGEAFARALEARLGLSHHAMPPDRINPSLSPVEMYWYPRLTRTVRALPVGRRLRGLYLRGAFANRFRLPIAILQRLRPGPPVTADLLSDDALNAYRGKAESLRGNPLYAPYASDYLLG